MDMVTWTLAVAAAVCLVYYGVIVLYTGIGTASAAIWLLSGGFFAVSAAAVRIYQKYPERMPMWIPVSLVTLCASGSLVVLTVLILIFGRIPATAEPDLDYVIVLGASVKPEGVSRTLKLRLDKAAEYENYAWQLYDTVLQGISKERGIGLDTLEEKGFQVTFQENMQAAMTADEIVTEDLFAAIDYNKRVRLERAKENIAFEQAETQRMEA